MSPARPKSQRLEVRGSRAPSRGDGLSPSPAPTASEPLDSRSACGQCISGSLKEPGKPHLPHPKTRCSGPRWAPPLRPPLRRGRSAAGTLIALLNHPARRPWAGARSAELSPGEAAGRVGPLGSPAHSSGKAVD